MDATAKNDRRVSWRMKDGEGRVVIEGEGEFRASDSTLVLPPFMPPLPSGSYWFEFDPVDFKPARIISS